MILSIFKKDNIDLAIIDEFYNTNELQEVNKEIKDLYKFKQEASLTNAATDNNKTNKIKTGSGVLLYDYYTDPRQSPIIVYNQKVFTNSYLDKLIEYNINYKHIRKSNLDSILLNYYDNNQYYDSHEDRTLYTVLVLLNIGKFKGGGVYFKEIDKEIEFKENRAIIFPGCVTHKAMPIQGDGTRVSVAHFISYKN